MNLFHPFNRLELEPQPVRRRPLFPTTIQGSSAPKSIIPKWRDKIAFDLNVINITDRIGYQILPSWVSRQ
jgi:hypothetical protein